MKTINKYNIYNHSGLVEEYKTRMNITDLDLNKLFRDNNNLN